LTLGEHVDERLLAHRLHRGVGATLLTDGGRQLRRQILTARRDSAVRRHHRHRIGQRQQLVMNRAMRSFIRAATEDLINTGLSFGSRTQDGIALSGGCSYYLRYVLS
jgi:hypothetical protein